MVILFTPRCLSSYNATFTLSAKKKLLLFFVLILQHEFHFDQAELICFWVTKKPKTKWKKNIKEPSEAGDDGPMHLSERSTSIKCDDGWESGSNTRRWSLWSADWRFSLVDQWRIFFTTQSTILHQNNDAHTPSLIQVARVTLAFFNFI